jgi:putative ubiquitin-RnfH superfamily antitoxin RatB of RatAB toxin-antitoxin module
MSESISVEVAYALPEKQRIVKLDVPQGTTALEAVTLSKLDEVFDELVVGPDLKIGVWGKVTTADRVLATGERVEIYRPLLVDPKEVRKARAAKAKAARAEGDQDASDASDAGSSD